MVKIRLSRIGKRHAPYYRIVAIDSRKPRDSKAIEILGTYNPLAGKFEQLHMARINEWVSKGARLSDSVKKLTKSYEKEAPTVA